VRHEEDGRPAPGAFVEGCGGLGRTDADGHFYLEVLPQPCRVLAMRQDGRLRTRGPMVEVHPKEGVDTVVDLVLPGVKRAGLGVGVAEVDAGIAVTAVFEGTAAFEAGLEVGDVIVEIDGVETVAVALGEFVELAGGPEGSRVALVVQRGDQEVRVEFERRPV
jgi:membrane-associated protease RseP (regulator of RpoE activity)